MPPRGRKLMKRVFIGLVIPRCLICTRIRIKRTSAASSARESILVPRDVVVPRGIPRHPRGKSLAPTQPSQPPSSPSFPSSAARGARRHAAPDSLDETLAVRGERALHRRVYRALQRRGHFVRIRQPLEGHRRGHLRRRRRMTRVGIVDVDARARFALSPERRRSPAGSIGARRGWCPGGAWSVRRRQLCVVERYRRRGDASLASTAARSSAPASFTDARTAASDARTAASSASIAASAGTRRPRRGKRRANGDSLGVASSAATSGSAPSRRPARRRSFARSRGDRGDDPPRPPPPFLQRRAQAGSRGEPRRSASDGGGLARRKRFEDSRGLSLGLGVGASGIGASGSGSGSGSGSAAGSAQARARPRARARARARARPRARALALWGRG